MHLVHVCEALYRSVKELVINETGADCGGVSIEESQKLGNARQSIIFFIRAFKILNLH
jgi:hypothetical protein